ncbi:hypothetical protein BS50DRAFT_301913 [Corynespora cassiicola Philippines]|uniref:Zn(2)-C6 fungal-type domain-containing protein n=1 Tax=Corynespora cassiicola Philippines TaxID=1448308 RepID=A0A2T2NX47_CORCC|nr:hypothetical protein BS50DRAFT_301913 [Corynespora cassiicola Philippines]
MPPLAHERTHAKDLKAKKTKSRNGCGRCKLKRLKCDETAPSCLQCRKRNVACPGYEKTLKWSTKYEVFQPSHFGSSPPKRCTPAETTEKPPKPSKTPTPTLPQDVVNGFEALAAVLPAGGKKPEAAQRDPSPQTTPPALEEPCPYANESSGEEVDSPPEPEPFPIDDISPMDPQLLDDLTDTMDFADEQLLFDSFDPLELPPLEGFDFNAEELQGNPDDLAVSALSSPRLSRSLLLDFYRLPSPSSSCSRLDDMESILVQHYFKDVCVLFSSFDSPLNPYRTTIGRVFQETPSIYYAIQSMAAAHLANSFPNMASVGVEMQRKACDALNQELPLVRSGQTNGTRAFLSTMLLGITTSWHESNALGEEFLATARSLILPKLLNNSEEEGIQRETQFFEESLIYWEMLMGFVTQDAMAYYPGSGLRSRAIPKKNGQASRKPDGKIVPHPWTGIAPTIQMLFAEVGRLVRRERSLDKSPTFDIRRRRENLLNASTLEEDLLAAEYPSVEELTDPGDERTPTNDFVVIAEAYRCAGLLELYRVFPSILRKRLGTDKFAWNSSEDFEFPTPRFETPYEDTDTKLWVNSLAMHILSSIESLPTSSGTICIQPILIVAAASELKFVSSVDYFDVYANDAKVRQAREFAHRRLEEYALRLPAKPLRKMLELIEEVWRRLDAGQNAFWIDVMNEMGWHTVMG